MTNEEFIAIAKKAIADREEQIEILKAQCLEIRTNMQALCTHDDVVKCSYYDALSYIPPWLVCRTCGFNESQHPHLVLARHFRTAPEVSYDECLRHRR